MLGVILSPILRVSPVALGVPVARLRALVAHFTPYV